MADALIAVSAHKPYWFPADPLYLPVQAGAALHPAFGIQGDDGPGSISEKNPTFCELTVLHWLRGHMGEKKALGLCHYRRYLSLRPLGEKHARVLTAPQCEALLKASDILLPKKRHYLIETNYSQYAHAHHARDLDAAREVLAALYPQDIPHFDRVMKQRSGHRFNLFVMKRAAFEGYTDWLFPLLFALEKRLDISAYSPKDQRVFGYVAERLMDVWLAGEGSAFHVRELPVLHLESQHWPRKIAAFLGRKARSICKFSPRSPRAH